MAIRTGVALLGLLAAGCAQPAAEPAGHAAEAAPRWQDPLEVERELAQRVDAQRAARRVRELCALGPRMGGTRSGARAAEYLREAFAALGLEVQVREDHPADACHEETAWRVTAQPEHSEAFVLESAWP